ncbi:hypothetical protein L9F63_008878 [Diploptera punctata]|uniref:C2H2-type domain-containing protein n=1 Tax=Diploptera punctata TaxID=6984 RepID=A0AAD7Z414_DIPPU|nr:hypothetical protein L9F63_008878 [Diploptera punctata]
MGHHSGANGRKMCLRRKKVEKLALQIVYDLATRVPHVVLHRVEDCYPTAKEKLDQLIESQAAEKLQQTESTIQQKEVIRNETIPSTNADVNKVCFTEPCKMVKQEILDDNIYGDMYCFDREIKQEMKEEMTFEEHSIHVDDNMSGVDLTSLAMNSNPDVTMGQSENFTRRYDTSSETSENWSSDELQNATPFFEITKIKQEVPDNRVMKKRTRYNSFMSLTPENSPVKSCKKYMVKFPSSVVQSFMKARHSKKKECKLCKKKFDDEMKLSEHMLIHSGKFICSVCSEVFKCAGALKGHIRVHVGERPYKCKTCNNSKTKSKCK